MQWFLNMKIATKLTIGFGIVSLIAAFIGYVGIVNMSALNSRSKAMYENEVLPASVLGETIRNFEESRVLTRDILLSTNLQDQKKLQEQIAEHSRSNDVLTTKYAAGLSERELGLFEQYKQDQSRYRDVRRQVIELAMKGERSKTLDLMRGEGAALAQSVSARLSSLDQQNDADAKASVEESVASFESSQRLVLIVLFAGVLSAVVLGVSLSRLIATPAKRLAEILSRVASGNEQLTDAARRIVAGDSSVRPEVEKEEISIPQKDEVGLLGQSASRIVESQQDLAESFRTLAETLNALVRESMLLSKAAMGGQLSVRANAEQFQGGYRELVRGMNGTLDAVVGPLNLAARYIDDISKGNIPAKITDRYEGEFTTITNSLNVCVDAVGRLVSDANTLANAAIEGRLSTRADATRHQGDFRRVIDGVNRSFDKLVGFIDILPTPAMVIDKDFTILYMNTIGASVGGKTREQVQGTKCFDHFRTGDCRTDRCACGAAMRTSASANSETVAHPGTLTLDIAYTALPLTGSDGTVIGAMEVVQDQTEVKNSVRRAERVNTFQEAETRKLTHHLERLAQGDLQFELAVGDGDDVTTAAREQFVSIGRAVETTVGAVRRLAEDTIMLSQAAYEGKLSVRAQALKHQGDFRKIVEGVNSTLDAVIEPIQEGSMVLTEMAKGDLAVRMEGNYRGDHQLIKESINTVAQSLEKAIREVTEAVGAVASASSQISSSAEQMAAGAQEQTSQAGEVASAVEEMTKTILENSKNAIDTAETAKQAKGSAEQGGKVVLETVTGMKRIAEVVKRSAGTVRELGNSSDQIGEIISVIDDIADQTNLLALNAAIEAARAGDQGRGFAVVADEVRKLAERTTKATKEIAGMIKKIQVDTAGAVASMEEGTGEVDKGITLADRAGKSLETIVDVSQKVTDMIAQIATASEEQSSASEQISKNVEGISKVTGETAIATQQIARAADDLNQLTTNLQQLVSAFHLSGDENGNGTTRRREVAGDLAVKANGTLVSKRSAGQRTLDVTAAKNAHKLWRVRVQKMMAGKEDIDEKEISSDHSCKLGLWYFGAGQAEFGNDHAFLTLGKKHEAMHDAIKDVVQLLKEGKRDNAELRAEEVYRLSDEVIALIDELRKVGA